MFFSVRLRRIFYAHYSCYSTRSRYKSERQRTEPSVTEGNNRARNSAGLPATAIQSMPEGHWKHLRAFLSSFGLAFSSFFYLATKRKKKKLNKKNINLTLTLPSPIGEEKRIDALKYIFRCI